jgi:hypothetical protein
MKRRDLKGKKVNKGAPSGFVISLIFHAAAFFIAGLFVVFTVLPKEDPVFKVPPPVERPKMKLKKPKVKIKKSSQPKPSARIVAKVKTAKMPEIQIPDLVGTGEGLLGGLGTGGEFMDIPDIGESTIFGSGASIGNDFVGTYYDFNRSRNGGFNSIIPDEFELVLLDFILDEWNTGRFRKFYQSKEKRYATCFMIPRIPSDLGPEAFGEPGAAGYCWAILYKGKLVHKDGMTFRFWGMGDDILMVRVAGELVLAASYPNTLLQQGCGWISSSSKSGLFYLGNNKAQVGDWITLEPGVPLDMEVLIGESPGGSFNAMITVEEKGVDYHLTQQGGPLLPMFTTDDPSYSILNSIYEYLIPGEAMLTNGPVFRDF